MITYCIAQETTQCSAATQLSMRRKAKMGYMYELPRWKSSKESLPANAGGARDTLTIPRLGRSPGVENGNLLQYSCLENSIDRGAWWATVHGVSKNQTLVSAHTHIHTQLMI